jgi:hypothetical protein
LPTAEAALLNGEVTVIPQLVSLPYAMLSPAGAILLFNRRDL